MRSRRFRPISAALAGAALVATVLVVTGTGASAVQTKVPPAKLIAKLPASLQALYSHTTDPVDPSAYGSFAALG